MSYKTVDELLKYIVKKLEMVENEYYFSQNEGQQLIFDLTNEVDFLAKNVKKGQKIKYNQEKLS